MGKSAGILKKIKNAVGFFTAKSLKAAGYAAKGIGLVADMDKNMYGVAKYGTHIVTGAASGIEKYGGAAGGAIGTLFGGNTAIGGAIGDGIGKVAGYLGNWVNDEREASKQHLQASSSIWGAIGNGLISVGDWFEPSRGNKTNQFKKSDIKQLSKEEEEELNVHEA